METQKDGDAEKKKDEFKYKYKKLPRFRIPVLQR